MNDSRTVPCIVAPDCGMDGTRFGDVASRDFAVEASRDCVGGLFADFDWALDGNPFVLEGTTNLEPAVVANRRVECL